MNSHTRLFISHTRRAKAQRAGSEVQREQTDMAGGGRNARRMLAALGMKPELAASAQSTADTTTTTSTSGAGPTTRGRSVGRSNTVRPLELDVEGAALL